jgi:hypothetical protein
MRLDEIMYTLEIGGKVYWHNDNYEVIKDKIGQYLIHSRFNDHYIGLTHQDGQTMNGKEEDFFEVKV